MKTIFTVKDMNHDKTNLSVVAFDETSSNFYRIDPDGDCVETRPVKGFSGYWVCKDGIILSSKTCRVLTGGTYGAYANINLAQDGRTYSRNVHRLVAEAFCDNPYGLNCVNHKDCNKRNNNADNLEWCTQRYNVIFSIDIDRAIGLGTNC